HPLGDINQNGILDAGDIILNFSDDIDDDQNGYADDISGWDFMKDDNNPYDDTRYGHGTGEAKDSVATGNDGHGDIGGCPKCRFLPMRVGDSFIADVNAFAQAVIYATDNGARVVQCALGTINNNRFSQAALDYAYENGVVTVASMADENARHHNMPVTSNHTLPTHAIQYSPITRVTNVESFLNFNPCTNYGGQNFTSVAGEGCSSEAVGQLSGMTGLLFSAALEFNITPPLTANEAYQLWFHTSDDIDVPESRLGPDEEVKWSFSQPGFDQRFGYGRVNANRAVEWLKDGKIPPQVDIVQPYWFEVLYRDQLQGPVAIEGTISAKRATSYDYVVEWAPGVQPLDAMFEEIASETNLPPDEVHGSDGPLALFDVRTIDTTHEPDPDSPMGENEHTITVRVRAIAHYGGDVGDVPGEMRRTYAVHSDPDLVKGFPIYVGDSGEASPKMADIDGDGRRDLIYPTGGGVLHVWKLTPQGPEPVSGFPFHAQRLDGLAATPIADKPNYLLAPAFADEHIDPDLGASAFLATPAIGDVDDDDKPEIVVTTWNGFIYVIEHDGQLKDGWPVRLPDVPSCPRDGSEPTGPCMDEESVIDRSVFASPVLEDMDQDGQLDIIQAAFDGKIYVFDVDGNAVDGWPVHPHYTGSLVGEPALGRVFTTPAVADFNGDGYPELVVGSNEKLGKGGQSGAVYLIDGRGTNAGAEPYLDNWPVVLTSLELFPLVAEGVPNAGVVGKLDGTMVAVVHGNGSSPFILPANPGPQQGIGTLPDDSLPQWTDPNTGETGIGVAPTGRFGKFTEARFGDVMFPLFASPSMGDIDQDGTLDFVAQGSSLTLAQSLLGGNAQGKPGQQLVAVWSGTTGNMLPGSPFLLEDYSFFNSQAIVDLNGDDYPEVITGSGGYFLHAWDGCGREPEGWPKFTGQWIITTPAFGDLDGDGTLEVSIGTRSGWVYAWHTTATTDGMIQWESYHHDNRNTGNYEVPLEQGDPTRAAAQVMDNAFCESVLTTPPPPAPLQPAGGCGQCAVGQPDRSGRLTPWLGALGLALALGLRRRRS
ncbi:MAG: VCBS repeat-containing protein, partial [Deltaproteobacteria bacterium]|nr:VCBS repeat-containing protein [Deltaproteobacteria bacterium]